MRDLNIRFTLGLGLHNLLFSTFQFWGLGIPADVTKLWMRGEVHNVVGNFGF
jgi:hypothetical protein